MTYLRRSSMGRHTGRLTMRLLCGRRGPDVRPEAWLARLDPEVVGMAVNVRTADRDQVFLMPPSVADWLPDGHLAWFVLDVVAELDLSEFAAGYRADGRGGAVYDPSAMLAVLLYSYCTGEQSSRRIERRLVEDVAFRVLAANQVLTTRRWPGPVAGTRARSPRSSGKCWACVWPRVCWMPVSWRSTARRPPRTPRRGPTGPVTVR